MDSRWRARSWFRAGIDPRDFQRRRSAFGFRWEISDFVPKMHGPLGCFHHYWEELNLNPYAASTQSSFAHGRTGWITLVWRGGEVRSHSRIRQMLLIIHASTVESGSVEIPSCVTLFTRDCNSRLMQNFVVAVRTGKSNVQLTQIILGYQAIVLQPKGNDYFLAV